MLDTDTVSFFARGAGRVAERLLPHPASDLCVSAVTVAELSYGLRRGGSARLERSIVLFIRMIPVAPFDAACGLQFGLVAAELTKRGTPIGEMDTLIAAHALTLNATLVTNNLKHFSRVAGLKVESWL